MGNKKIKINDSVITFSIDSASSGAVCSISFYSDTTMIHIPGKTGIELETALDVSDEELSKLYFKIIEVLTKNDIKLDKLSRQLLFFRTEPKIDGV